MKDLVLRRVNVHIFMIKPIFAMYAKTVYKHQNTYYFYVFSVFIMDMISDRIRSQDRQLFYMNYIHATII